MEKTRQFQDLYADLEIAKSNDSLVALLNSPPKESWIKTHPVIANYKYLPIDKIEYLLKKIFKKYRIEIIREGVAFNGVYMIVRVWYLNPVTNEMDYHDGVGAEALQVKKGFSASDLSMINNGALKMAFPIAKTIAIKDACDHFGTLFGSSLNIKDVMYIEEDEKLHQRENAINKLNQSILEETKNITVETLEVTTEEIKKIEVISPEVMQHNLVAPPPIPEDDDF